MHVTLPLVLFTQLIKKVKNIYMLLCETEILFEFILKK